MQTEYSRREADQENDHKQPALIDVMIPLAEKDLPFLRQAVLGLLCNSATPIRRVYVVIQESLASRKSLLLKLIPSVNPEIVFINENKYPFSIVEIRDILLKNGSKYNHASWYYQQLLKLYSFRVLPGVLPRLLIHDADFTITSSMAFINQHGQGLLAFGYPFNWLCEVSSLEEYGAIDQTKHSHIDHARRLVPGWKVVNVFSGMHHHQFHARQIVEDMMRRTEKYHRLPFWKAFVEQVDISIWNGASEYVLYFHFALTFYSDRVATRHINGVDVIHDANSDIRISADSYQSPLPLQVFGVHNFVNLQDRIKTMDYIPRELRSKILSKWSDDPAFKLELRDGILIVDLYQRSKSVI